MRGVFVDANEALAVIFERLTKPGDPAVRIHRDPDVTPEQLPRVLDGAGIAIVDHTALPTEIARQCAGLKHVVFLGTGARSYMNPEELAELGIEVHLIRGYGDTAVAESTIALMWAAARGIARMDREMRAGNWLREDGMQLTGKTLGPDRLRRHRRRGGAHRARQRHARAGLEPVAEDLSRRRFRRHRTTAGAERYRLAASVAERRNPRLPLARTDRGDEARRHPRQHRARRVGRRSRDDRCAEVGPHPARRARCLQHRAAAGGSPADATTQRHAVGAFGLPHAGGERESDRGGVGALPEDCGGARAARVILVLQERASRARLEG